MVHFPARRGTLQYPHHKSGGETATLLGFQGLLLRTALDRVRYKTHYAL